MGDFHTCARVGERVACWGDNTQHQITATDEPQVERPRFLPEVSNARAVRCGGFETCVLTSSGGVECWGGRPAIETLSLPRPARELRMHSSGGCVKLDDGRIGCWRRPASAGTRTFAEIEGAVGFAPPFDVPGGADRVCVTRSGGVPPTCFEVVSPAHVCAVRGETISCSGAASRGQLGAGPSYIHAAPVMVPGLDDATQIEATASEACATRKAGRRVCWGQHVDANGSVERTSFAPREVPVGALRPGAGPLAELGVKTRQVATDQQCGVDIAHRLVCATRSSTSTRPGAARLWRAPSKERFASAGGLTYDRQRPVACGRTEGGRVLCFRVGAGPAGAAISSSTIDSLTSIAEIEGGGVGDESLSCARDATGIVSCWGDGRYGQLGVAPSQDRFQAVRVATLPAAVQVAVGGTFACALAVDGHVWCWGSNRDGAAPTGAPGAETNYLTVTLPAK